MQILAACLCDFAADYGGKLCIMGAFDSIVTPRVPSLHPACAIALRFLTKEGDEGAHALRLSLMDPDGRECLPNGGIKIDFKLQAPADPSIFNSHNVVVNIHGITFNSYAQYSFDIYFDSEIVSRIPLQVIRPRA